MGCALQACESERVSPGVSGQVLKCSGSELAPRPERVQILVGHSGMFECAGQIEAEVVGGAEHTVGGAAGLDLQHLFQHSLLMVFRDHVVENAQDVGLLAEDFLVGIVGEETG